MKSTFLPLLLFLTIILSALPVSADRLVLKEGKTLHGTITDESKTHYEIRLGAGMFLRVEKDKVAEVYRKKKKERSATVVTMESMEEEVRQKELEEAKKKAGEESAKENKEKEGGATPQPVKPKGPQTIQVVKEGVVNRATQGKGVTLYETLTTRPYRVDGKSYADVFNSIYDLSDGKGFKLEGRRNASQVEWKSDWSAEPQKGKEGVSWTDLIVRATMTVVEPSWTAKKPAAAEVEKWNAFLAQVQENDSEQTEIILKTLMAFAERARLFQEKDEPALQKRTQTAFEEALDQADKRLRGFRRRHRIEK